MIQSKHFSINITMLLFALYPTLNIYQTPFIFAWGDFLIILVGLFQLTSKHLKKAYYPKHYYKYWIYLAISYFILSLLESGFKIGALIPGGWSFFVFSIVLGIVIANFDFSIFRKYYRVVFLLCALVFFVQELMFTSIGYRFAGILPFGSLTDGMQTSQLISEIMYGDRSTSLFREPAHFAQFLLPLLAIELFSTDSRKHLFSKYSLTIIAVLLFLRSGNGILGVGLLCVMKVIYYFLGELQTKVSLMNKIAVILIGLPILYFAITKYVSSELGSSMIERVTEIENDESAASYVRIYRGFRLYADLPLQNQLFGITQERIVKLMPVSSVSFLFKGGDNLQSDLYFNGIQNVLIWSGGVGLFLFFSVFFSLFKGNCILAKSLILTFFLLSLIAQVFLSFTMMTAIVIPTYLLQNKKKDVQSSILH